MHTHTLLWNKCTKNLIITIVMSITIRYRIELLILERNHETLLEVECHSQSVMASGEVS